MWFHRVVYSSPVGSLRMSIIALPLTVWNPSGLWHHWKLHTNFHFLLNFFFSAFSPAYSWSLRICECVGLTLLGLPSPWNFDHASSGLLGVLKLRFPFLFFMLSSVRFANVLLASLPIRWNPLLFQSLTLCQSSSNILSTQSDIILYKLLYNVSKEKGATENEMVGWDHWLKGHEYEQTPEDNEGQQSQACCTRWSHKE